MNDEPMGRKAMRIAERGARADASRLVAAVPDLMREARRRRDADLGASTGLEQLADWALPRLAVATALAVIAAAGIVFWDRPATGMAPPSFESVVLGGDADATSDVVFDAMLDPEGNDG